MKILSIAGRNLNSLRIDFKVDFTTGVLKDCGIFAITGPTGAGKTTLLDAITLALYGRTPRSATDEDIISYGAGEAWAEVVFQTSEGMFKSEWKVRRARSKHDGTLQQSTMEVSSYPDGKILTQRKREAQDKIRELIKLEYDQFLKSVLLAQGAFKAFLDAKEGERGEMLEKISDTSLYTQLSKRAFERKKKEEQALEILKATIGNVVLLSEEEHTTYVNSIIALKDDEQKQQKELTDLQLKINWLKAVSELTQKHQEAEKEVMYARELLETERPNLQRWEAHSLVAGLEPEYLQYLGKMQECSIQKQSIEKLQEKLDALIRKSESAETTLASAEKQAEQAVKLREEKMPGILEAITRQGDMILVKNELDKILGLRKSKISEEADCQLKILKNEEVLTTDKKTLEKLAIWIREHQRYSEASAGFNRASLLVSQLERSQRDIQSYQSTISNGGKQLSQAAKQLLQAELDEQKAIEEQKSNEELRHKTIQQLSLLRSQLSIQAQECTTFLKSASKRSEEHQNELSRQQFLAEHLSKLHEGEPCPLCGASAYPNKSLSINNVKDGVKNIKIALDDHIASITANEERQKKIERLLGNLDDFQELEEFELEENAQKLETTFKELMQVWKLLPKKENDVSLKLASTIQSQQNFIENITHFETVKAQAIEELHQTAAAMEEQVRSLRDIAGLYHLEFDPAAPGDLPKTLKNYSDEYQQKTTNESVLKGTIPGLETGIVTLKEQVNSLQKDLLQLQVDINEKQIVIQQYHDAISAAHEGSASPEAARDKLNSNEKTANDLVKQLSQHLNSIRHETGNIQGEKNNAVITFNEVEQRVDTIKANLEVRLLALGWEADTRLIQNRLLRGNERAVLEKLHKTLNDKLVFSLAYLTTCKEQLGHQQSLNITNEDTESIAEKMQQVQAVLKDINQQLGEIGQILKDDDRKKNQLKEIRKEIEVQEKIFQKWAALSDLIGSADGKKFNQFAQGLTLDRLILVANHHLQLINDRYLLKRNTIDHGLCLLIIDQYQANNEREINTLSGGESFLVSLALALGLSEMTSKLTTIDSLFIDEGFGTLDADTLEVALNALRGLQIGGKTIGIISHVERLKEEIYTQVEITKGADGFSTLKVIP